MEKNNYNSELENSTEQVEELLSDEYEELEEEEPLSKEAILERFRRENEKVGDERERKILNYGLYAVWIVGVILIFAIYFVNLFCLHKASYELLAVINAMSGVSFIWQGIVRKKARVFSFVAGILFSITSIINLVYWIFTLAV